MAVNGSVVSHQSALVLHGLAIIGPRPSTPLLTVTPRGRVDVPDAHVHRATLPDDHVTVVDGVAVTSIARTLIDVARAVPPSLSVPSIDQALNTLRVGTDELREVLACCHRWPGARRAVRALELADPRSESPLESVSRLVVLRLGLPTPELQCWIRDEHGTVIGRLDFYWDEFGVAGEADGRLKYTEAGSLVAEKERQERLEATHLAITRWGWDDAWADPGSLGRRLRRAFERGSARDAGGVPRLWTVG